MEAGSVAKEMDMRSTRRPFLRSRRSAGSSAVVLFSSTDHGAIAAPGERLQSPSINGALFRSVSHSISEAPEAAAALMAARPGCKSQRIVDAPRSLSKPVRSKSNFSLAKNQHRNFSSTRAGALVRSIGTLPFYRRLDTRAAEPTHPEKVDFIRPF